MHHFMPYYAVAFSLILSLLNTHNQIHDRLLTFPSGLGFGSYQCGPQLMSSTVCKYGACWSGQDFFSALHAVQVGYGDWKYSAIVLLIRAFLLCQAKYGRFWSHHRVLDCKRQEGGRARNFTASMCLHEPISVTGLVENIPEDMVHVAVVCNWHFAFQLACELKILPKDTTWVGKQFST